MLSFLLALCLLLVMGSLILTLSSSARVDTLNKQNELLRREMEHLRKEYHQLAEQVQLIEGGSVSVLKQSASDISAAGALLQADELKLLSAREKMELVKQEAYRLQGLVEAYALQNSGEFPQTLDDLKRFVQRKGSQDWYLNPYTTQKNLLISEDSCLDITHDAVDEGLLEHAGKLLYQAHFDEEEHISNYTIAVFDELGVLLRREDGSLFTLSHKA
ncbi:hypothetical protein COW36_23635 [bacterium (Candidatus Blackallbacteria) CG17_big_fil_post_rev_8_21_14_2_50_48_46]|uniref:Uncharacterized protein n=1 Tax=bacterium (Candidatus Blackallbacteria) CG17_big_fil_post_rev_8_21_14_2_50_48_46 TaxID=2014261 RepID=A0A2M7FY35_9BACT|nr:MAG: hypothetical protein COW64_17845 [bacterium (Candidatus Blackallbacteria) CG18_big_fil_WC_8_21_14_2_50_49_26]PIW14029.1 MAG: hypothetical protein COW36_23635 [bacterium (Candidatus Blackallbacteria) CG17_big_fil_post_rev_8_21_14_2_50_48_46]PIW50751.1 MAG: hypothetical protein COW20_01590 [bacterium (Candidatus Blackallbacteria) CG13_big_fil_rev_8_21_14_2_50_49_14]